MKTAHAPCKVGGSGTTQRSVASRSTVSSTATVWKPVPLSLLRWQGKRQVAMCSTEGGEAAPSPGDKPAPVPKKGFLATADEQKGAYNLMLIMFAVLASIFSAAPTWTVATGLGVEANPALVGMQGVSGAYMWLALACVSVLRDAAVHNRLSSDTYKRVNLALMSWGVSLLILAALFYTTLPAMLVAGYVVVATPVILVCGHIYKLSNQGSFDVGALVSGLLNGAKYLFQPKSLVAAAYGMLTFIHFASFIFIWGTDAHPLFLGSLDALSQYMKRKMGAGLLLAGMLFFVQYDGANRGRLGGGTFKQINLALAVFSVVGGYYFWYMLANAAPVWDLFVYTLLAIAALTAVLCDMQYFLAKK